MSRTSVYCKYYDSQQGGEIPIFRGGQHGGGLGDILRGFLRFIAPVALRGISTFASSTLQARGKGASFKDAARDAIAPSLSAMASTFRGQQHQQEGGSASCVLFRGEQGVPFANAIAYKGNDKKRKQASGRKKSISKKVPIKRRRSIGDDPPTTYNY